MSKPRRFNCPGCSQEYEVGLEHLGMEMECHACKKKFTVPNLLNIASKGTSAEKEERYTKISEEEVEATKKLNSPVMKTLNEDEISLLQQEGDELLNQLKQLKRRNCWEFSIIASMLENRIALLKQSVVDVQFEQSYQKIWKKRRGKFNYFIVEHTKEFFSILEELSKLLGEKLCKMLFCENISSLCEFIGNVEEQFIRLQKFHEKIFSEPMPQDETYEAIQQILTGWVPYCCQSLDPAIEGLEKNITKMRDSVIYQPQVSFAPPTLHQFYKIAAKLDLGFERPRTVFQDLS